MRCSVVKVKVKSTTEIKYKHHHFVLESTAEKMHHFVKQISLYCLKLVMHHPQTYMNSLYNKAQYFIN